MQKKLSCILLTFFFMFLVGGSLFAYYHFFYQANKIQGTYAILMAQNPNFSKGELLFTEGKYQEAAVVYEQALADSKNKVQEGFINFKIAAAISRFDLFASIPQLKAIVANKEYTDVQRASVVQYLGELFYKNTDQDITGKIFIGDPYSSFLTDGNARLAHRKLFEYAISFYPLAISELRVARWYADAVLSLSLQKNETRTSDELKTVNAYTTLVANSLRLADADIKRTTKSLNDAKLIPRALTLKAIVIGLMWRAGNKSFGDPEIAFKEALKATLATHEDGAARVSYAAFLARAYGKERARDIIGLLQPIYQDFTAYPAYRVTLSNSRKNILGNKAGLVHLASIDPGFRQALLDIGWQESDFN